MNKKDLLIERTSISDIKEIKGEDGVSRHELNTPTKIIVWIKYQFEQQEIDYNKEYRPFSKRIDLSNCIINTSSIGGKPSLKNLSDILKANDKGEKLDCFINNGFGNKYNHEVKVKIDCRNSLIHSGFFQNTKFHESVNFEDSTFDGYASFSNCLFTKYANFQNVKFIRNSNFDRCIFNEDVYFNKVIFDTHEVSFDNSIFKGNFHGQSIEFKTDPRRDTPFIDFRYSEFHKDVDLSYSKFNRACYFGDAKFHGNILFRKTHFEVSICFYDTVIGGNILFTAHSKEGDSLDGTPNIIKTITFRGAKISGRIDFENCEIDILEACFAHIQKGALFRIYESKIKRLDFTSVYNDGAIMLEDNQDDIEEITFKSALNTGLIEVENTNAKTILDRKTARLLKDSAFKSGNNIDGLNYKAKEMALYRNELTDGNYFREILRLIFLTIVAVLIIYITRHFYSVIISYLILSALTCTSLSKWFVNRSIFKSYPIGELLLLNLNTISNKNGLSWFRGLTFTLVAWILFYGLFIMSRDGIGDVFFLSIETNREGFINYLWLPSGLKDLFNDSKTTSWLSSSIFILGKIAIAYGIYQTITAFRKYKN
ncbi:pentapeptide repeat-containing protein [Labilibaculum euxinus]